MSQPEATWTDGQPVIVNQNDGIIQLSDADKLNAYFKAVHDATTPLPDVESEEAKRLLELLFVEIAEMVNRYAIEAGKL